MTLRKISAVILASMMFFGATLAQAADYKTRLTLTIASAGPVYDEAYLLTVPADFTITSSGWNSLGNITAKYNGSNAGFDTSKKLVVTAASTNSFALKSGENSISYTLKTAESDTSATTRFEFTAAEINAKDASDNFTGTSKAVGVQVEDYSSKPNGTYEDEITYTVAVQGAGAVSLADVLTNGATLTVSCSGGDEVSFRNDNGTFTQTSDVDDQAGQATATSGNLVVTFGYFENSMFYPQFSYTFNLNANTYTIDAGGMNPNYAALASVEVNDADITSTLTKQD